jgi:hypothetical protein
MQVKPSQAIRMMTTYITARLVPMLVGSPGCGKSDLVRQIAKKYNLKVIDLRLSQCDPTDLLGFPNIKGTKAGYVPMETFPLEGDKIPDGYSGWLLFLDEFNSAGNAVQAAAYKITLDRMVGIDKLHANVAIICAGNLDTDNAIVNPMSTALQSRLAHLELVLDTEEWCTWASENQLDHRIVDYIRFRPGNLYTFKPDHTDRTYACPRTWAFASRVLEREDVDSPDCLPLLAGVIGEGVAREFLVHCKIYETLPKIAEIVARPDAVKVPQEPSILYAITGSLADNAAKDNLTQLMKYIGRLPEEFQVVTLRDIVRRNKTLAAHPAVIKWTEDAAVALF